MRRRIWYIEQCCRSYASPAPMIATLILYDSACSLAASDTALIGTLRRKPCRLVPREILPLCYLDRSTSNRECTPNISAHRTHFSAAQIDGLRGEHVQLIQSILFVAKNSTIR